MSAASLSDFSAGCWQLSIFLVSLIEVHVLGRKAFWVLSAIDMLWPTGFILE